MRKTLRTILLALACGGAAVFWVAAAAAPAHAEPGPTQVGENEYVVTRTFVRSTLNRLPELADQVRVEPEVRGDTPIGFALHDIEDGSLFDQLGLEDGDILQEVNGTPMTTPAQAMQIYATLRTSDRLELALLRDGQPYRMVINIR